jgi:hypothetical protein
MERVLSGLDASGLEELPVGATIAPSHGLIDMNSSPPLLAVFSKEEAAATAEEELASS